MREVLARTARPGHWVWLIAVAQGCALASWLPRLQEWAGVGDTVPGPEDVAPPR